jgi:hypothetical protein
VGAPVGAGRVTVTLPRDAVQLFPSRRSLRRFASSAQAITRYRPAARIAGTTPVTFSTSRRRGRSAPTFARGPRAASSELFFASRDRNARASDFFALPRPLFTTAKRALKGEPACTVDANPDGAPAARSALGAAASAAAGSNARAATAVSWASRRAIARS